MATLLNTVCRSPWRVTAVFDTVPTTTATDYVFSRADGVADGVTVNYVFFSGATTVEIALNKQLTTSAVYFLSYQSGSPFPLSYQQPLVQTPIPQGTTEDPEGEAYGIDIDWFADTLTASGDLPLIHGLQCLRNDLAAVAVTFPGEIYHRPDVGAAMQTRVNGPNLPQQLSDIASTLKRVWASDDRVIPGGIDIQVDASVSGQITAVGKVQTVALGDPITVKTPGSS